MVSERARLEHLLDRAYSAYSDNPTDKNREKWEAASQALNDYNESLATHIQQLIEYKNSVNYAALSTEQQREDYRNIGDDIDRFSIMMGSQGSIYAALSRMFGEEEITADMAKLRDTIQTALAVAGDDKVISYELDLTGCESAVSRLRSVGITLSSVIGYFEDVDDAAEDAFDVSTYEIIEDISSLKSSIDYLTDAFREFSEEGMVTAETLVKLNSVFGTLGDAWKSYVNVMTNGDSTIQDAVDATNHLAEARIQDLLNSGGIRLREEKTNDDGTTSWVESEEQYKKYLTQVAYLEQLGVTNAKELIDAMQQQAMIAEAIAQKRADATRLEALQAKETLTKDEQILKNELENRNNQYYIDSVEKQYGIKLKDGSLIDLQAQLVDARHAMDYASASLSKLTSGESDFWQQALANMERYSGAQQALSELPSDCI